MTLQKEWRTPQFLMYFKTLYWVITKKLLPLDRHVPSGLRVLDSQAGHRVSKQSGI